MHFLNFSIHSMNGYISTLFLAEYEEGLLLLDSGSISDVEIIENYCHHIGRQPSDIKLIVVTHMHPDHSGGACALREKYHIPIAAFKSADRWYAGLGGYIQYRSDCYMGDYVARRKQRPYQSLRSNRILRPDYLLEDSALLPVFSDWQVFHVPGHTLHDIALWNDTEHLLYVGDCICEVQGQPCLPLPVLFPPLMRSSFTRLASLQPSLLLLAHGPLMLTQDHPNLFEQMLQKTTKPRTSWEKRIYRLSVYSPEIWKYHLSFCPALKNKSKLDFTAKK